MKRILALAALAAISVLSGCAVYPAYPGVYVGPPAVRVAPYYGYYGHGYYGHRHRYW